MAGFVYPLVLTLLFWANLAHSQSLTAWGQEFPNGDFAQTVIPYREIEFDGNTRDSIPPIDAPVFIKVRDSGHYAAFEPVISITLNGDARAYPLQILLWHEIVNDTVGGEPVLITYCPLCNSGVVFDRILAGRVLDFGNTGRLRHLDMVMYDRQTESWWQQFTGGAIIGSLAGKKLRQLPSHLESMASFAAREPDGLVLFPEDPAARPYGSTPFAGMDTRRASARFSKWPLPDGINPMQYVVIAKGRAWPLERIRINGEIHEAGLHLMWNPGRNSLHDNREIARGRDLGYVTVITEHGDKAIYDLTFAFAFAAFIPDGEWMLGNR